MTYSEFAIEELKKRLIEKSMKDSTPKKFAGDMFEAYEVIKQLQAERNKILDVEELKNLQWGAWVWIEALKPFEFSEKVSAYYKKQEDYTHGRAFTCGYPGLSFGFEYAEYNETWVAYRCKPEEKEQK